MIAASSRTERGMDNLEDSRSSSDNAYAKFLSLELEILILLFHFLKRYNCALFFSGILRPLLSLFLQSIVVDKPLSDIVKVDGAPVLARLFLCSWSKALHSGPLSIKFSSKTQPQRAHVTSALWWSTIVSVELQTGHIFTSSFATILFNLGFLLYLVALVVIISSSLKDYGNNSKWYSTVEN